MPTFITMFHNYPGSELLAAVASGMGLQIHMSCKIVTLIAKTYLRALNAGVLLLGIMVYIAGTNRAL